MYNHTFIHAWVFIYVNYIIYIYIYIPCVCVCVYKTERTSNQSILRKINLDIYWKDWCWSWSSSILVIWWEQTIHCKSPWCWESLRAKEKRVSEDEMVGWYHWCNEHELGQTLGDGEGEGGPACCSPWGHKELDTSGDWTTTATTWNDCYFLVRLIGNAVEEIYNPNYMTPVSKGWTLSICYISVL